SSGDQRTTSPVFGPCTTFGSPPTGLASSPPVTVRMEVGARWRVCVGCARRVRYFFITSSLRAMKATGQCVPRYAPASRAGRGILSSMSYREIDGAPWAACEAMTVDACRNCRRPVCARHAAAYQFYIPLVECGRELNASCERPRGEAVDESRRARKQSPVGTVDWTRGLLRGIGR